MPLVKNTNTTYYSIDIDEVAFKRKLPDGTQEHSGVFEGTLVDVRYREDEYKGRPANKYQFVFRDEDGGREVVSSGENSVFSGSLINALISLDNPAGTKLRIGVYQPDGKEYIANWVYKGDDRVVWAYPYEQIQKWAEERYEGDKTALFRELYENKLADKFDGGRDENIPTEDSGDAPQQPLDSGRDLTGDFDDLDDDLPF